MGGVNVLQNFSVSMHLIDFTKQR